MTHQVKSRTGGWRAMRYLAALLCAAAFSLPAGAARAQTPFYHATAQELAGPPGSLIRSEPMMFAPAGAQAYRVLYRSVGMHGEPIAVSGVIVVPPGPAPAGGRPIVAWAHPTTGVVPHCAPSLAIFVFQQMAGLRQLIEQGAVVAATDYPGLGHRGSASLSRRRQRSAGGDQLGARRAQPAGRRRRQQLCGLGSFARRTGVALYRPDCEDLCAGASSGRCFRRSTGDLARHPDGRRFQELGRQEPHGDDVVVVVAGLWRADRQGGRARGDADRRPAFQRMHRIDLRHPGAAADRKAARADTSSRCRTSPLSSPGGRWRYATRRARCRRRSRCFWRRARPTTSSGRRSPAPTCSGNARRAARSR